MKKILLVLITAFIGLTSVSAKEKVKLYVFTGQSCDYCNVALKYLYDHQEEYQDDVEIYTFEVWKNEANSKLFDEVKTVAQSNDYLIPFFLISNTYGKSGYIDGDGPKIIKAALNFKDNDKYVDLIGNALKKHPEAQSRTLKETLIFEGVITESNKYDTLIISSIFIVLGIIVIIFFKKGFDK